MLCLFIVTRRIPHQPHLAQRRSQPFHRCRTSRPILQYLRELARGAIRVVVEDVMREELDALIGVGWGESSPKRKGYRNGFYRRDLVTSSGRLKDLKVPRDREREFHTQVFERYNRDVPEVAEALTEMCVSGTSTRYQWGKWRKN